MEAGAESDQSLVSLIFSISNVALNEQIVECKMAKLEYTFSPVHIC